MRSLSTVNHSVPLAANFTAVSKSESREFMSVFPDLVRDLTDKTKKYDRADASKWFAKALQYNVPRGKKNRGLVTVMAYKILVDQNQLTPENLRKAQYLGWCVEMLQSVFLITDDIMDGSTTRRGQPCWYKNEDVGMMAINDGLMIENGIYYILKKNFEGTDYYIKLVELFHETMMITTIGQSLDVQTSTKDITSFTMDRYKAIVEHKTAFYTFYLPVALAMHMAGYTDPEVFRQVKTILLEMGYFFQVQDDFLDCFGNPEITGKIGTDIQENKCTWLSVLCMQRASRDQKEIMKECYGKSDPEKVKKIVELYAELGLPHTYTLYEEESYNLIKTHIQQTSRGVPHKLFFQIMDKIYRRDS
ncbi:Farnesyl pyrophosphate synthase [Pseudolycoriella hygida]|uniref:Farnesyl pyrophosphate synthase n=1 Tax=Pseudolycoriella hygida TaxID=35572 RepID=A0A9Q0N1L0_9DIPT|nr:Farnesyl pyrophosphate synthase [Pseudolycoriella hygida]